MAASRIAMDSDGREPEERRAHCAQRANSIIDVFDETWSLDLAPKSWRLVAPLSQDPEGDGNPSGAAISGLAFFEARGVMVCANGATIWEWNGRSWAKKTPTDPEADGNPTSIGYVDTYQMGKVTGVIATMRLEPSSCCSSSTRAGASLGVEWHELEPSLQQRSCRRHVHSADSAYGGHGHGL